MVNIFQTTQNEAIQLQATLWVFEVLIKTLMTFSTYFNLSYIQHVNIKTLAEQTLNPKSLKLYAALVRSIKTHKRH